VWAGLAPARKALVRRRMDCPTISGPARLRRKNEAFINIEGNKREPIMLLHYQQIYGNASIFSVLLSRRLILFGEGGPPLNPVDERHLGKKRRLTLVTRGLLVSLAAPGRGDGGGGNRLDTGLRGRELGPVACRRRPDLPCEQRVNRIQPLVQLLVARRLHEVAAALGDDAKGGLDDNLLVCRVLCVRPRQVDETAFARVALVAVEEDVGATNNHPATLPHLW
jgi:hypothetical protein